MRIIFMGSPEFSVPILSSIISAGHDVVAVYCQPPRPAGRGKKERLTPVHSRALELGLDVRHPVNFCDLFIKILRFVELKCSKNIFPFR